MAATALGAEPGSALYVRVSGQSTSSKASVRDLARQHLARDGAVRDLTPLAERLFEPGMLVPEFTSPALPDWPVALAEDWNRSHAACRARVGPPGRTAAERQRALFTAVECHRELAVGLYARLVKHHGPAKVLEVAVQDVAGGPVRKVAVSAYLYRPQSPTGRNSRREVPLEKLLEAVDQTLKELQEGGGSAYPRSLNSPLPGDHQAQPRPTAPLSSGAGSVGTGGPLP